MSDTLYISIVEDTSDESMFGSDADALIGIDAAASVDGFIAALEVAVEAAYPGATVLVAGCEGVSCTTVGDVPPGQDAESVRLSVDAIRHALWESWDWLVQEAAQ